MRVENLPPEAQENQCDLCERDLLGLKSYLKGGLCNTCRALVRLISRHPDLALILVKNRAFCERLHRKLDR